MRYCQGWARICFLCAFFVSGSSHFASADDLVARIQAEATRLTKGPISDVFAALTGDVGTAPLRLTKKQVEFSRRLDEIVKAVLKSRLLRGLNSEPRPPADELAARLDDSGKRDRQAVIAHADAMVLEGILRSDQARVLRNEIRRKPTPMIPGRYRFTRNPSSAVIHSVGELKAAVKEVQNLYTGAGGMSSHLFRAAIIQIVAADKPTKEQIQLGKNLKLSRDELDLATRLNRLNCEILVYSLSQQFARSEAQLPDDGAADWFDARIRLADSFVAHAESLLLRAILSPSQAEALLACHWRTFGPVALTDPDLASLLHLARSQRDMLVEQMNERRIIYEETVAHLSGLMEFQGQKDRFGRDIGLLAAEEKARTSSEADWLVWSVLTPAQLRKLDQIIGTSDRKPATPGKKRRPSRPS